MKTQRSDRCLQLILGFCFFLAFLTFHTSARSDDYTNQYSNKLRQYSNKLRNIRIVAPAEKIFIPQTFDSNDDVEIILYGELRNYCYQSSPPLVSVNSETLEITVTPQANYYSEAACEETIFPYTEIIRLGLLKAHVYTVTLVSPEGAGIPQDRLPIRAARAKDPNDPIYASIDDFEISTSDSGEKSLILNGTLPNSCFRQKEVITLFSPSQKVIELQPIVERISQEFCTQATKPFHWNVALPENISGKNLVHIRANKSRFLDEVIQTDLL